MNKIFLGVTAFSFSLIAFISPLHADNNNPISTQESQQPKISETKNALIKEICDLSFKIFFSDTKDDILYFFKPIESEFKALGFTTMPFEQTIKKLFDDDPAYNQQLKDFAFTITLSVFGAHFSEEELKELLEIYKNPLFQKHIKFLCSGWFAPLIDVLKDPKLYEKYESKINQIIDINKDLKHIAKNKEFVEIAKKEIETLVNFIQEHSESLKEKFKTQFPAIAPFAIPFFERITWAKSQGPIIGEGLKFENLKTSFDRDPETGKYMILEGEIKNTSNEEKIIPLMKCVPYERKDEILSAAKFKVNATKLQPGESTHFETRLPPDMHLNARDELRFYKD
ncbi:MAG: hypothetical protein Q8L85_10190 [Alphaproteobacteria bacterium]|nr:hypothetical protein [Alphaproteobacteria bacterium]